MINETTVIHLGFAMTYVISFVALARAKDPSENIHLIFFFIHNHRPGT